MSIKNTRRAWGIVCIFLFVFITIIARLANLQLFNNKYIRLAENNAILKKTIYARRGIIFDRKGEPILDNTVKYDLVVIPSQIKDFDTIAFCDLLRLTKEEFVKRINSIVLKNGRIHSSIFQELLPPDLLAIAEENIFQYPAFQLQERPSREYPYHVGAQILGYIGEVDSSEIKRYNYNYQIGDWIGKNGVEEYYESILKGQKGVAYFLRDNKNRILGQYDNGEDDVPSEAGKNIHITVDIQLQELAEQLLHNKIGAIVALDPRNGDILAMASAPSFDPNLLSKNDRKKNFSKLFLDIGRPLLNRAIKGQYPPGSTFKPLGGLVALDEGVITVNTGYPCLGKYTACGNVIKCLHTISGHAANFRLALANSCNSYFCDAFRRTIDNPAMGSTANGYLAWKHYLNSFGLGVKLGVDLPGEEMGNIPDTSTYNRDFKSFGRWKSCNMVTLGIGQDRMTVTPLQMANAISMIANQGYYYIPHFINYIDNASADDSVKYLNKYHVKYTPVKLSRDEFEVIINAMNDVTKYGTASTIKMPDIEYCAKTGTAQNPHGKDHSWFVAFAPKENPQIVVAVIVENAGFGVTWAGPIAASIVEKYLHDTLSVNSQIEANRIINTNLLPTQVNDWYVQNDSAYYFSLQKMP